MKKILETHFPDWVNVSNHLEEKEIGKIKQVSDLIKLIDDNVIMVEDFNAFVTSYTGINVDYIDNTIVINSLTPGEVDGNNRLEQVIQDDLDLQWEYEFDSPDGFGIFKIEKIKFPILFDLMLNKDNTQELEENYAIMSWKNIKDVLVDNYQFNRFWDRNDHITTFSLETFDHESQRGDTLNRMAELDIIADDLLELPNNQKTISAAFEELKSLEATLSQQRKDYKDASNSGNQQLITELDNDIENTRFSVTSSRDKLQRTMGIHNQIALEQLETIQELFQPAKTYFLKTNPNLVAPKNLMNLMKDSTTQEINASNISFEELSKEPYFNITEDNFKDNSATPPRDVKDFFTTLSHSIERCYNDTEKELRSLEEFITTTVKQIGEHHTWWEGDIERKEEIIEQLIESDNLILTPKELDEIIKICTEMKLKKLKI